MNGLLCAHCTKRWHYQLLGLPTSPEVGTRPEVFPTGLAILSHRLGPVEGEWIRGRLAPVFGAILGLRYAVGFA